MVVSHIAKLAALIILSSSWNLAVLVLKADYDSTIREARCSPKWDDSAAMRQAITVVTDILVRDTYPMPESAYLLCVVPDPSDDRPDVWGRAKCPESITKDDCSTCLRNSTDALMSGCAGRPGAHMYRSQCYLQYKNYKFCNKTI